MKTWIGVAVAILAVVSSYIGAHRATENALRAPEAQPRLAVARVERTRADSQATAQRRAQRIAEGAARARDQIRRDAACLFDFKHASGVEDMERVFGGHGAASHAIEPRHTGTCELVGTDSVRWVQN